MSLNVGKTLESNSALFVDVWGHLVVKYTPPFKTLGSARLFKEIKICIQQRFL